MLLPMFDANDVPQVTTTLVVYPIFSSECAGERKLQPVRQQVCQWCISRPLSRMALTTAGRMVVDRRHIQTPGASVTLSPQCCARVTVMHVTLFVHEEASTLGASRPCR